MTAAIVIWGEWGLRTRDKVLLPISLLFNRDFGTVFVSHTRKPHSPQVRSGSSPGFGKAARCVEMGSSDSLSARLQRSVGGRLITHSTISGLRAWIPQSGFPADSAVRM